jgi:hypothetical protein
VGPFVSDSLAELLVRHRLHALSAIDLQTALKRLSAADPSSIGASRAELARAQAAGDVSRDLAAALLAALTEDSGASEATQLRAPTVQVDPAGKTLVKTEIVAERRPPGLSQSEPPPVANSKAATELDTGTVIKDRFVLKEQIGRGGMGIVFAALDRRKEETRDPNPWVAIKILNPEFAHHSDALVSLQREARKAQSLAHPNVATVFDFDRDDNMVYLTMELLRGKTLSSVVQAARGHGVDRVQAWSIVRDIASGLAYAHRKGIVHADLKPGNVFLLDDGRAKILDFGIARAVSSGSAANEVAHEAKDTFDAGVLGAYTEAYATEEMMTGTDPHPADDIYALGLIAYELLAGQHPYQRRSSVEARKLRLKPDAPKGVNRREWRVLQRCLSFDRRERPRDAAEFLRQLAGIRPLQKALIAASLVLALAAGFFAYRSYIEAGPAIPFAQLPADVQQQWKNSMSEGDQLWQFYQKDHNVFALQEAVEQYAAAYQLHPRNREASQALERVADAALEATKDNADQQRAFARGLAERSDYLAKYSPVKNLAK